MKLGILTQPLLNNYGGLLQNYALQQVLIGAGYEVETIDWRSPKISELRISLSKIKWSFLSSLRPQKYKMPNYRYVPTDEEIAVIRRNTNQFINTYIRHTNSVRSFKDFEIQAMIGQYDGYIVGSDQCWRPRYNPFLPAMFLNFVRDKNVRRIAYAASFGTDNWEISHKMTSLCAPLAQKFDLVTVREDSGVGLCKEHLGVEATHVIDPTMLLAKEDYIRLIEAEKEPKSAGTLFNYVLDPDEAKTDFINRVAESMELEHFRVLPKCQAETWTKKDVRKRMDDCIYPRVTTWLRAFMDAEMIIADSFHGAVFSILFNKQFWVIGNVKRGMSRFTSLLRLFGLEDRLVDVSQLDKIDYSSPIDWEKVNSILEKKRDDSKELLLTTLK